MDAFRFVSYALIVVCFIAGAIADASCGRWKLAVIAVLFAAANGVIFFWR